MKTSESINRRAFLQLTGSTGAMLVLGFSLTDCKGKEAQAASQLTNLSEDAITGRELNPFIIINSDGKIILMAHKPEMGQGTWQSMPLIIAEELEVTLDQVQIRMAKVEKKYGDMSVGGSYSVRGSWMDLRKAGAAAREMLTQAAANTWKVPVSECYAKEAKVYHKPSNKSLPYGELVEEAAKLQVPKEPKLKDPKDFKLVGQKIARPDIPLKVNGTAQFGIDVKVPGMLYVSVLRSPVFHGTVKNIDDTETKKIAGVKQVIQAERKLNNHKLYGIAVLADNYWAALQGKKALKVEWNTKDVDKVNTDQQYTQLRELTKTEGVTARKEGDFAAGFAKASKKVEAIYELPFAAHAPMEPQNCVAWVQGNKIDIWAPTQIPDSAKKELAEYLKIPEENITLNITFLGGGFGRRLFADAIMEAAYISKQANAPVKVVWTREDDMTGGPFRPGTVSSFKGGLDASGKVIALQHKVVAPSIMDNMFGSKDPKQRQDDGAMEGIKESSYEIPNISYQNIFAETTLPIGWWRAVYSTTTAFAHECFIDELAHTAKKDPLDFRIGMIQKNLRMKSLYTFLRDKSGWDKPLPKGWGKGVAAWEFFAGRAGHVVFVSKKPTGGLQIEKIVVAIDCGTAVNPDNVKSQVEGATVMALMAALRDSITFKDGVPQQTNFDNYRMMRMSEIPSIEVHLVPSVEKPDGVGEPGLPPLAPALANAVFAATGKRIRKLPFDLDTV
ncbi:xanthine dehydrogenase family protein molybdopterin-binding subunit [Cytophagaceae bacterium DM2B3-1]|uniref:Xanthine dehydrogenase family protein molybdopterin-binding subunit n=1 Tax=Xanthocytophaga flava TaxID=3048013 RepID=A0ABT7CRW0_9BACT|nr:xanthine dehydrogenase family protein molybdopterin-binding subunit [Xanthocytophaga flavus]MDJ1495384.1 xanthine dehydrogenase family protein molybdopterin-binding subunit [Xanthocytophaga flavus]